MKALKQYLPSLGMVLATVLGVLYTAMQDNVLSLSEFLMLMISLAGAVTTYIVPRAESIPWLKILMAGVTAALTFAVSALVDGSISTQEWVMVGIQLLAGLGLVASTNAQVPITKDIEPPGVRARASG